MKPASTLPRFLLPLLLCLVTVTVGGDDTPATASSIRVNGSANGAISPAGDVDYWRFNVPAGGQLVVETAGDTDTIGALEDSAGNLLQEHDDQDVNTNRNFKIERAVTAGVYYIRISAYRNSTGDYTLHVRHTPESGGGAGGGGAGPSGAQFAMSHALGDLNGDGRDDVLLRHTDGRWHYYPMNGPEFLASQRGAAALTSNPDWQFAALGDLNGDGRDDVLLRRVTDGRWYYYPMNGRRHLVDQRGGANIISDLNWQLAGIGDLNNDGRDDVLLRHTDGRWLYYPMNGREYIAGRRATANLTRDLNWQVAGIGDLNGDGNDDVLLRHTDGRWHYYPMNGPEFLASQRGAAALTSNPDWQFAAIGDLNGDGRDDVLLRRVTDGRWYYYPMNGRRHLADQRGGANIISDLNWQLAGTGDLNGDGRDDVLLRHTDGRWLYYPMNGREYIAGRRATANLTRDLSWGVVTATSATQGNQGGDNDDGDTGTGAPDLVVESPSVSDSTPTPGDAFSFTVRVRNQGDARSGSTTLRYYRSTNSTVNSSDTQVGTDSVAGLSGGGNISVSETLVAPSSPGTYYYGACVDAVNGETNTGNNCSGGVRVTVDSGDTGGGGGNGSGDDHSNTRSGATSLSPNGSRAGRIDPGNDTDYFSVRLGESGTLTVYTTGSLDTTGELQSSSGSALGSDDDSGSGRNFRIEREVGAGTYYIKVESYRTNTGSYTLHADFSGGGGGNSPDLTVDTPTVSNNSLSVGSAFTLRAVVRNRGNGSAAATTLRYYRSANSTISGNDTQVGTNSVGGLSASASSSESIRLDAPSSTGTYYYGACVDTVSGEGDTGNNCSGGVQVTVGDDGGGGGTGGDGGTGGSGGAAIPPVMVSISGGTFRMGDLSGEELRELPAHSVTVPAFRIGKYEVTFAQWDACLADGGCNGHRPNDVGWGRGNRPVINVSWNDVQGFIDWLNGKTGGSYRLPTEAEWEYAARAGSATKYSWGNDIGGNRANCYNDVCGDSYEFTAPVGSFPANAWGLHDMLGNVWEWVQDCYNGSYRGAPNDGSAWESGNCSRRVIRGGSFNDPARTMRSASRVGGTGTFPYPDNGFRLAQDN